MKFTKVLATLLCIVLLLSLCSCVEEESEETLKMPPDKSIVEYHISEDEYIRLYCGGIPVGEWICGDEIKRVVFDFYEQYWGIFASRYGVTEFNVVIYELESLEKECFLATAPNRYSPSYGKQIAYFNEGMLNSTQITLCDTNEVIEISSIVVNENQQFFDWIASEWKVFCSADEQVNYKIENHDFEVSTASKKGEWGTNGTVIPIRIVLDELACFIEIYDISGETEKCILAGNGYMDNGKFIVEEFRSTMFYENSVQELTIIRTPKS